MKLWLPFEENKGGLIFRKVLVLSIWSRRDTNRSGFRTTRSETLQFLLFFDIFLLLRSTKEVTTENLSLNKWKTWPAEISEDCKKCEKKITRRKTQNSWANLEIIKFSNPPMARTDWSEIIFWLILIYGTLKSEFVCESYGCFMNGLRIRGQNCPKVGKICGGGYKLIEMVGKNTRTGL